MTTTRDFTTVAHLNPNSFAEQEPCFPRRTVMHILSRPALFVLLSLLLAASALAQAQAQQASQQSQAVVTATATDSQVRYVSIGEVHQSRLQVFSSDGALVYDSGFRLGNLIDWRLTDQQGTRVSDGSYVFLVTVKDFSERLVQKYGTATVEQEQVYLEQGSRNALAQAQAAALDSNKQADTISSIDRVGAAGLNRTANAPATASPTDNSTNRAAQPSGTTTSTTQTSVTTTNVSGTGTPNKLTKWQDSAGTLTDSVVVESSGNIGIGNPAPVYELDVQRTTTPTLRLMDNAGRYALFGVDSNGATLTDIATAGDFVFRSNNGRILFTNRGTNGGIIFANGNSTDNPRMTILGNGNVGIGTATPAALLDVAGNLNVAGNAVVVGNIAAKYQDVAEWVESRQKLAAGTVVTLDTTKPNAVLASTRAYDTKIAGVVSAQPGVVLGESGEGKVMVATTGRVRVKVDATRYAIKVGDLLVTSNKTGMAMRSVPIRVNGRLIHRPGTIIGKALEPLANGKGEILVLLSLQ